MMRLVVVFALVAAALAQSEEDGSYNAEKYENPYAYSEQQAAAPQQYQPQPQQYQPQPQQYQPQPQQYQPQQYQPQPQQYQPQPQQYQPQQYQPQQYQPQPQAQPQYRPQQYSPQPQQYQGAASLNGLPQTSTNYKTQDHERFENVDGQGNVRGQYSYVDPNGKTITVKYTAGKDGFQVEGDHLPRAPVPGAAPAAAPAYQQPAAYQQPRYQPAAPAYQPAAPAYRPAAPVYQQAQAPSAASQFLNSPLQHRFAAPGGPAPGGAPAQAFHQAQGNGYNYNY